MNPAYCKTAFSIYCLIYLQCCWCLHSSSLRWLPQVRQATESAANYLHRSPNEYDSHDGPTILSPVVWSEPNPGSDEAGHFEPRYHHYDSCDVDPSHEARRARMFLAHICRRSGAGFGDGDDNAAVPRIRSYRHCTGRRLQSDVPESLQVRFINHFDFYALLISTYIYVWILDKLMSCADNWCIVAWCSSGLNAVDRNQKQDGFDPRSCHFFVTLFSLASNSLT